MAEPVVITPRSSAGTVTAPTAPPRYNVPELVTKLAQGRVWGLAQSLGELLDVLALLVILRVEEQEEAERRAVDEFNGTQRALEFPEAARWETLRGLPPEQSAAHFRERVFPAFRDVPVDSPLALLPRLFQPERFAPATYQAAVTVLSSPLLPFDRYLGLERGERAMAFEDKTEELFTGWKGVGEFITPGRVADLMIDLAAPKPGERIYNPCTGFGTLLTRAAKRIVLPGLRELSPAEAQRVRTSTFFGMELNPSICLVALARLMLAGITRPRLELGDVLERPTPDAGHSGGFDVILCNPPFGVAATPEQMARFPIRSRSMETLTLQHILAHLRPGGRAVVLMPEAFLYRQGAEETLRKRLLTEFRLEAVVAVPEGSIYSLGEIRTSILVIHRSEPLKSVVFVPAPTTQEVLVGYEGGHRMNEALPRLLAGLGREAEATATGQGRPAFVVNRETTQELASRRWELVARSQAGDPFQIWLDTVTRTDTNADIRALRSAHCSVCSGMSYRRSDMVDDKSEKPADGAEDVRLVRVRDLSRAAAAPDLRLVAAPTMARMTPSGIARTPQHCFLRAGDVLLTVTGTVGKVAVVGEEGRRMVAASGLSIIRVRDQVMASYLPRLLTTEPYQSRLKQLSRGVTVGHLTVKDVERLRIPVFPAGVVPNAIQHLAVGQSLESMVRLLEAKPGFSATVKFILEDPLVRVLTEPGPDAPARPSPHDVVRDLVRRVGEVRREGTVDEGIEPLFDWLGGFGEVAARLLDIVGLPLGPERFSSLQAWKLALDAGGSEFQQARQELARRVQSHALREVESEYPAARFSGTAEGILAAAKSLERRAQVGADATVIGRVYTRTEAMLDALVRVWRADSEQHMNDLRLTASLSPAVVTMAMPVEVSVSLTNEGLLPLRKLVIETRPFESRSECALLRPGASHRWPLKVLGREIGRQTLWVRWTGRRMDESEASGEIELAFEVVSLRTAAQMAPLQKSPYVVGSPLDPKSPLFFGRDDIIQQINRTLRTEGPSTVVLLEGNRRVGKSSLLKRLAGGSMPASWVPVYVNFQSFEGTAGKPGMATQEIFYGIARELIVATARAATSYRPPEVAQAVPVQEGMQQTAFFIKQVRPLFKPDNAFETFRFVVESALEAVAPRRVLLMLDEFDKIQEGIDSGLTSPQLPENLRNLFHSYDRVSGILTGSRTIRRLRQEYWNVLFGLGIPIAIKGLDEAAATKLVAEPVNGQLVYAPAAVEYVVNQCARQPFLIQGLCHSIFELCVATDERSVTMELAGKAAESYALDNEHFRSIWDQVGSHRRRYLVCLVDELTSQSVPVTLDFLRNTMEQRGLVYPAVKTLTEDLEELVAFEILGSEGDQRRRTYRIEIPIFSNWLRRNTDAAAHRLEAVNEMEATS